MREIIITKVYEDTILPIVRKTDSAKRRDRLEHVFLKRQERYFIEVAGDITFSSDEWYEICKRGVWTG